MPKELTAAGVDTIPGANRYLAEHYRAAFNEEFTVPAAEPGTAFVPFIGPGLGDIVCEHYERTVSRDNCVSFEGKRLQIPAQTHRCHFIKARVRVHRYPDGAPGGVPRAAQARRLRTRWFLGGGYPRRRTRPPRPSGSGSLSAYLKGTGTFEWTLMGAKIVMTPSAARWVPRHGGSPVDLWTSPTDRREPYGPCGQARGQRSRVAHTLAPLAHNPTGSTTDCSREQPDSSICCQHLPEFFAGIDDPRRRQGRRHMLPAVLAIATAATLCGARTCQAMAEWAHDLSQRARERFRCRHRARHYDVPSQFVIRKARSRRTAKSRPF